ERADLVAETTEVGGENAGADGGHALGLAEAGGRIQPQAGREEAVEAVAVRQGAEVSRGREEIARQRGPLEHEGGVRALEPLDHVLVLLARERADRVHEQAAGADERGNTRQDLPLERGEARDVLRAPPPA